MDRKFKVISINSVNYGSTGSMMLGISDIAKRNLYETFVAYPSSRSNNQKSLDNSIIISNKIERNIHLKLAYHTGMNGRYSKLGTKIFLKKISRVKPDIIHLHNLHNCYINVEMLFKYIKEKNIPTVWTLHDCWAFTGHCPYYSIADCSKWKTECYQCPIYKEYPASRVDRSKEMYNLKKEWFTEINNLTIVTPSEWLANEVNQSFLGKYPIKVIYNGIDLEIFQPKRSNFRYEHNLEGKVILLGVAFPWSKRKGLDLFINLANVLPSNYKIVLLGLSSEQIDKLPENILGLPKTSGQSQLVELYSMADYFINPSQEETMGLVTVEALACGTPAIVSNLTAVPEMIDSSCGMVVKSYDADSFCESIITMFEANNIQEEDCVKWAKKFDKNMKFDEYIELYREIVNK